jgi:NADH-quinone oxidoreductase subunit M
MPTTAAMLGLMIVPFAAALVIAFLGNKRAAEARWVALGASLVGLVLALLLTISFVETRAKTPFDPSVSKTFEPEFVPGATAASPRTTTWTIVSFGDPQRPVGTVQFFIGIDGLNVWLILLTAFLMVPSVLVSWNAITERVNEFYAWLMILGACMFGVFLAFDMLLFYVFFELTLVPLYFLIGIWGGPERRHAARKFFVYTLAGSVVTFVGMLAIVIAVYHKSNPHVLTFSMPELVTRITQMMPADHAFWSRFQIWVFFALIIGYSIKVPLFPVHTWLPLAHVEAPTAGSVLLAGILLKMGSYSFLRICLPLVPDACINIGVPLLGTLAVVGIVYGAICALAQDDIKKLIAYSSISHLGFCMLGMFALNLTGLTGSLLQMINHGVSTGGLFFVVGMLYERYHTRKIADYGGIATKLGLLSAAMVFICMSSVGLPGLNGFPGEALVFFGMYKVRPVFAIVATAGILLGAMYLLGMLKNVFFGPLKEPGVDAHGHGHGHAVHAPVKDLDFREMAILGPIIALCLLLGFFPQTVIKVSEPDLIVVTQILDARREILNSIAPMPTKVETKVAEAQP